MQERVSHERHGGLVLTIYRQFIPSPSVNLRGVINSSPNNAWASYRGKAMKTLVIFALFISPILIFGSRLNPIEMDVSLGKNRYAIICKLKLKCLTLNVRAFQSSVLNQ